MNAYILPIDSEVSEMKWWQRSPLPNQVRGSVSFLEDLPARLALPNSFLPLKLESMVIFCSGILAVMSWVVAIGLVMLQE